MEITRFAPGTNNAPVQSARPYLQQSSVYATTPFITYSDSTAGASYTAAATLLNPAT